MEKLKPGEHFFYRDEDFIDDLEFIVLKVYEKSFYAIAAELLPKKMPFDTGGSNNWETSSLREWLNTEFVKRLYHANLLCRKDDGITLISEEEYAKYKHLIPKRNAFVWTRSPLVFYSSSVWSVSPDGSIYRYDGRHAIGVSPTCTFSTVCMKIKDENGRKIIYYE